LASPSPEQGDEARFKREIVPRVDAFSLKEIGEATGLSLGGLARPRGLVNARPAGVAPRRSEPTRPPNLSGCKEQSI